MNLDPSVLADLSDDELAETILRAVTLVKTADADDRPMTLVFTDFYFALDAERVRRGFGNALAGLERQFAPDDSTLDPNRAGLLTDADLAEATRVPLLYRDDINNSDAVRAVWNELLIALTDERQARLTASNR